MKIMLIFIFIFLCISVVHSADNTTITPDNNYLKATKNCQSNDLLIKSLTNKVIKSNVKYKTVNKTKITKDKATKIFNYVNKKKSYSFYYNTKYGAKKMVKKGSGNCVDKAHLLIAMMRSVKIPARYVHAKITTIYGNTYGHIYTEVKIGNKWVISDPTHRTLNKFGKVGNWKKSKVIKRYNSLPF